MHLTIVVCYFSIQKDVIQGRVECACSDRYRLDIDPTRKCRIDVDPMVFAIWEYVSPEIVTIDLLTHRYLIKVTWGISRMYFLNKTYIFIMISGNLHWWYDAVRSCGPYQQYENICWGNGSVPPGQGAITYLDHGQAENRNDFKGAHDATITSLWSQNDVVASFRRHNDVIIASCARWIVVRAPRTRNSKHWMVTKYNQR